ncbi:tetratricopeptide repeat protein [Komagataeibacter rhaeticus]|nr:tetratricopeptide repeat protein [Komagataeibacter rhaeticus]
MWLRHLGPARLHDQATLSCLAIQMPLHPPRSGRSRWRRPKDWSPCCAASRLVPHAPLAWALAALFRRNAALFHQDAALDCARQVVAIHTTLAQVNPVAFNPALAAGLDALAAYANSLHHHDEALTAARRAVTLYTRLATQDSACLPLRARSLRILADSRCGLKQYGQAEQAVRRALDIQTLLPGTDGTDHDVALAESHLVLSACQAGQQQHEDAVENALQAVILYTPLARQDPDTGLPGLARALRQVASMQYALKRHEEALKSLEESFSLHTLLEERDTGDYRPQIGASLEMLSLFQNAVGRHAASLHSIMEAVARYRVLAAENPQAFRPMLSDLLLRLGLRYVTLEPPRLAESVQATREAVDELALLARDNPRRFTPKLVENRVLLAKRLEENGEDDAAAITLWAAIDQLLALTREDAATFHQPLLETTEILGELFKRHGRMEEMEQLMQALIPCRGSWRPIPPMMTGSANYLPPCCVKVPPAHCNGVITHGRVASIPNALNCWRHAPPAIRSRSWMILPIPWAACPTFWPGRSSRRSAWRCSGQACPGLNP